MAVDIRKSKNENETDDCKNKTSGNKLNKYVNKKEKYDANQIWWMALALVTVVALGTRLSYLHDLPGTTWDEVHFGGFANKYINKTFFMDVHPPLGKIFVAAAAYVTGYRATFNFSEGNVYDDSINFQLIRSEMALLGAALVPLAFLTVYELTRSTGASVMAALAVICDTFLHKLNTLILLDPILIFSISFSVFSVIKFYNHREREWSAKWWLWMALTGVGLGTVMSIKYVGVFSVLFVGIHTAYQLFAIACDKRKPLWHVIPHTFARVLCLIILPIAVYIGSFLLHFAILTETKPNEGAWLHTRFYASLNNSEYDNKTFSKYVTYGSNLTIQSSTLPAGYLDSWYELFPSELSAPCQVVSSNADRDPEGTKWIIKKVNLDKGDVDDGKNPTQPPVLVRNGDFIMLTHTESERSLRSHGHRAALTKRLYQVCGYGDNGAGGPFETWQVIIPGVPEGEALRVFEHDFMLKHYKVNCYLTASEVKLPTTWANANSKEVACTKNPAYPYLLWHINWIETFKVVGETTAKEHVMDIWERIVRLHKVMFILNAGLIPDPNEQDLSLSSSVPWMWPLAFQMQLLAGYNESVTSESKNLFAVGAFNPLVAYWNVACLLAVLVISTYHLYKHMRPSDELEHVIRRRQNMLWSNMWLVLCWALHYLPFFFLSRVLYLHHYCPAYLYSCMITGITLNFIGEVVSESIQNRWKMLNIKPYILLAIPASSFIVSYVWLYPLATYTEGEMFKPSTRVNSFLDKLYVGQYWIEFGYQFDQMISKSFISKVIEVEENNFENPFLNATLYYTTHLNTTRPVNITLGYINPTAASNFSLGKLHLGGDEGQEKHVILNNMRGNEEGGEKTDNQEVLKEDKLNVGGDRKDNLENVVI